MALMRQRPFQPHVVPFPLAQKMADGGTVMFAVLGHFSCLAGKPFTRHTGYDVNDVFYWHA